LINQTLVAAYNFVLRFYDFCRKYPEKHELFSVEILLLCRFFTKNYFLERKAILG